MKEFVTENIDRNIFIKISDNFITFCFKNDVNRFNERQHWINNNDIEVDENEPKEPTYFYWIDKEDWVKENEHWISHMERKNWFTEEMKNYINENIL